MGNIYKEGQNRKQQLLFPPSIDEYVSEENPVRAIDAYVEMLDMAELGFTNASLGSAAGQPAYHPKLFLKMYIYGYLNRVRSSRSLEKENSRNLELMWLTQGLRPGYKSIANFRKDNAAALRSVFKSFVGVCRELNLLKGECVAVDGAFLRANASKNQLITKKQVQENLKAIETRIEAYLAGLDETDRQEDETAATSALPDLAALKAAHEKQREMLEHMEAEGRNHYCQSDPDASVMRKPAHNVVAYNAQIAVDDAHKLIVATDVSTKGVDSNELSNIAEQGKEALRQEKLTVVADAGYYSKHEIKECIDGKITPFVPMPDKENRQHLQGKYARSAFVYDRDKDAYLCPANHWLQKSKTTQYKSKKLLWLYKLPSATCKACPLKDQCLPDKTPHKRIFRWEHEDVIDEYKNFMQTEKAKALVKRRSAIVEHPFGTIKRRLGWDHYLVRGKQKVLGETSLIMFTYNFARVLKILGHDLFKRVMKAIQNSTLDDLREEIEARIRLLLRLLENLFRNGRLNPKVLRLSAF
jgi:transposase